MEVHGNLDMLGNEIRSARLAGEVELPRDAQPGRLAFANGAVWFCTRVESGASVWVPMTQQIAMFEHVQAAASAEWTLAHTLNTSRPVVQVFDSANRVVLPDEIVSTFNLTTLMFNTPITGSAVLLRGPDFGTDAPLWAYQEDFTAALTWVVNHGLGRNPQVHCVVDGEIAIPYQITHNTLNQTTITWSSATAGTARLV